jgi:hypothetical protein
LQRGLCLSEVIIKRCEQIIEMVETNFLEPCIKEKEEELAAEKAERKRLKEEAKKKEEEQALFAKMEKEKAGSNTKLPKL